MSIGGTDEPRQLGSKTKTCQKNARTRLDERLEHQLGLGCASAPLGSDKVFAAASGLKLYICKNADI